MEIKSIEESQVNMVQQGTRTCYNCGFRYPHSDSRPFPAKDQNCNKCGGKGHFARVCKQKEDVSYKRFDRRAQGTAQVPRLKAKRITYRCFKNFDENEFLSDVRKANFEIDHLNVDDAYEHITKTFRAIVDKHAPLKTKILRGNTAPFMNRDLRKGIYTRSRLQKKLKKYPSLENEAKLKKQRNKYVSLRKKAIRNHFKNATSNGLVSNQDFWNLVKPFLSNKGGAAWY